MDSTQNVPLSAIITSREVEEPKKKTREDWRKAKELEEARKAGTAPAAVDEHGRDINPHIPQYISQAPWYFGSAGPTLQHQRPQPEKQKEFSSLNDWYIRGEKGTVSTRYRKGACENCGALTHKKKECLERPRKVGAKYTGDDIAHDELPQPTLNLDYDGKRDRWNGYDPEDHKAIIDQYVKIEEAKRQLKAEKLGREPGSTDGTATSVIPATSKDVDSDADEDEDKYVDDVDMPGTKVDSKQRITVRNLRIREDTAKYLRNLDPNSAYYDPKTRSMRDNPHKNSADNPEEVQFAGDNFVRYTGDTTKHAKAQLFAWEAYEKGVDVHLLAEPTKLELLRQEFDKRKDSFKQNVKESIVERYGGAEHLDAPPKELLLAQTEDYIEYSKQGKVIKGQEKPVVRSKYEEDVYINNHSSVWGSFWKDGYWGYKCCYLFVKNSYCTGESGKSAIMDVFDDVDKDDRMVSCFDRSPEKEEEIPKSLLEQHREKLEQERLKKLERKKKNKKKKKHGSSSSSDSSDSDSEDDDGEKSKKLQEALRRELENQDVDKWTAALDDRKRAYNSMREVNAPTDIEMEAYYMKKQRDEDPMADFVNRK